MTTSPNARGLLVAVEGIDGAGKTTQVKLLEQLLAQAGIAFVSTKEPTTGPWGRLIRESAQHGRMSREEELEAFLNDRRQHVHDLVGPALASDKIVIVDRYYLSTVAYQGARGLDPKALLSLNSFAPAPDILIVLDVPPLVGLQRIRERGDQADHFEREDELARARMIFRQLEVPNLHLFDGTLPAETIAARIGTIVLDAWIHTHPDSAINMDALAVRAHSH